MVVAWRAYLLKAYALAAGVGLFVFGLAGFTASPLNLTAPENLLHVGLGLLFFGGGLLLSGELTLLCVFIGGMGFMLVLGKGTIIVTRWVYEGFFHIHLVGAVCLMLGMTSLLLALFVGRTAFSGD